MVNGICCARSGGSSLENSSEGQRSGRSILFLQRQQAVRAVRSKSGYGQMRRPDMTVV